MAIIDTSRRIDWNPGVVGVIPSYNVDIIATEAPYNADNTGVSDATSDIQDALNACTAGMAVYLPTGTYRINSGLSIPSQVVLRGNGPANTKLIGYGNNDNIITIVRSSPSSTETNVTSGYTKGSTSIVVSSSSGFSIGGHFVIDQLNDSSFVDPNGANCNYCSFPTGGTRLLGQLCEITNIVSNTISLDPGLYYTFEAGYTPQIHELANTIHELSGIEDLYVEHTGGGNGNNIHMREVSNCWIKNVESYMSGFDHFYLRSVFRCEVRECYVHHGHSYGSGRAYGVMLFNHCCDCLIEDNIFYYLRHSMIIEAGGCGNVFGYNWSDRMYGDADPADTNWLMADLSTHGAHTYMNLWEGNVGNHLGSDYINGSGSHNTFFRNFIDIESELAGGGLADNHIICVDIHKYNYYINIVGNILGQAGDTGPYEAENINISPSTPYVYRLGYISDGDTTASGNDSNVLATLLRHGNYDYITDGIIWDGSIADHDLPNSYYLTSKPSFFGNLR